MIGIATLPHWRDRGKHNTHKHYKHIHNSKYIHNNIQCKKKLYAKIIHKISIGGIKNLSRTLALSTQKANYSISVCLDVYPASGSGIAEFCPNLQSSSVVKCTVPKLYRWHKHNSSGCMILMVHSTS